MNIQILGVGTAVPAGMVTQQDAARMALATCRHDEQMTATLPAIYEHTTIRTRHSVLVDSSSNGHPATQSFFPVATSRSDRGPTTAPRMQRYEAEAADLAARAAPLRLPRPAARPTRSSIWSRSRAAASAHRESTSD